MTAFDLIRRLKSKVETDAQIEDSSEVVTEVSGDTKESKAIFMKEIEGKLQMIEVSARVIDFNIAH